MSKQDYVYILTNQTKTVLYVGVTSNLEKRVYEHKNKHIAGFTRKYKATSLIYYEEFSNITDAIYREKSIKGKSRLKKEKLIAELNPRWLELRI